MCTESCTTSRKAHIRHRPLTQESLVYSSACNACVVSPPFLFPSSLAVCTAAMVGASFFCRLPLSLFSPLFPLFLSVSYPFKGGDVPPSNVQLCGNKRLVIGFSDEAFAALKTVSESDHPSIDVHCLSKNLLDHQIVTSDLKAHPLEQSFLIHILAR